MSLEEEEEGNGMLVERFNLYLHHGFTVVSIAVNDEIGRVCVLRKSDFIRTENIDGSMECTNEKPYFLIEFYNSNALPVMCFEKSTAIWDTQLRSAVWLNNLVFVSCDDGSLFLCSPFSTESKRFQMYGSPIVAIVTLPETNQLVLGTDSSELLVIDCIKMSKQKLRKASLEVRSIIKISDERILSIAASKRYPSTVAIGTIDFIRIFNLQTNKRIDITVPNNTSLPIFIWSLEFVDKFLFAGNSRGKVFVYNSRKGNFIKTIRTHQRAAVLALATDGTLVFASGVDSRITIIRGMKSTNKKINWVTVGQRNVHASEVRTMACAGERWLLSGGAEHDLFITDAQMTLAFPILPRHSYVTRDNESCFILMRYPNHLFIWRRHRCTQPKIGKPLNDVEIFNITSEVYREPVKYARVDSQSPNSHVSHAAISPNGANFAFFSEMGLKVFVMHRLPNVYLSFSTEIWDSGEETSECWKSRHPNVNEKMESDARSGTKLVVTAMRMTNDYLFFAEGSYVVWRLRLRKRKLSDGPSEMFSKKRNIVQLHVNESYSTLIALNSNSQNSQVLKWCAPNCSGENINDSSTEELPINRTVVDMVFVSDVMLLVLCAEFDSQVVFFDLSANSVVKVLSREALWIGFDQFPCYVSGVLDDRVVLVTNKGKVRILLQLKKASPLLHIKKEKKSAVRDNSFDLMQSEDKLSHQVAEFCRSEPSWGFRIPVFDSSQKSGETSKQSVTIAPSDLHNTPVRSVLLIGHQPLTAPCQMQPKSSRRESM